MHLSLHASPRLIAADGRVLALTPRDGALLAWLALEGPTPRQRLTELFWPDSPPEAARSTLRQRLLRLRRQVGLELVTGQATLALAAGVRHDLDEADDVLAGESMALGAEFDRWLAQQRERRQQRRRRVLAERADAAERAGDFGEAAEHARELLALDALSEDAHRRLMRLHYLAGDRAAALLAFDRCEQVLKNEVGTRPSEETLALLRTVEGAQAPPRALAPARRPPPATLLRPPRLVGRDAELDELTQVLADAGRLALVGEAGMGKSRLLGEAAAASEAAGGRPLVLVQARPGDAAVPYATMSRCLRAICGQAPQAAAGAPAADLARLLPELGTPAARSADVDGLQLQHAVQRLLARAAETIGGVLLDDLHFVDESSARLLQGCLGDAAADAGMALVMATRPQAPPGADTLLRALQADEHARCLTLAPLDGPALARLLDSLALPGLDAAALAPGLLRHTGGNPMFVLETLKHAWDEGRLAAPAANALAHPRSVGQLIEQRLQRLSPDALSVARLAALAGPDFGIEMAEALLHTPALRLADAWNELEAAQVMRGERFAHDLVFEAVLRSVPPAIAGHSHRSLALWLEQRGGEPERIAGHWQAAGEAARSVPHLLQAGERSLQRAFMPAARMHFERAAQAAAACGLAEAEFDALHGLHHAYTFDDPGAAHDAVIDRLDVLADTPLRRLDARLARQDMARRRMARVDPAAALADVDAAQSLGDDERLLEAVNLLLYAYTTAGRPDEALAVFERHGALLEAGGDIGLRAEQQGNLSMVLANLDRFAEADALACKSIELLRARQDWTELMVVMCNRQLILRNQGRHAALDWLEQIDRLHATDGSNPRSWLMSRMVASELLRDAGRYADALRVLAQERERVPVVVPERASAWVVAEVALWLQLGQHARALQAARAAEPGRLPGAPAWLQARVALAHAQARARSRGQGTEDRPDDDAWALLNAAADLAPRDSRRSAHFEVELQRAAWADPDVGAALAEGLAEQAQRLGMMGYARRGWWLACARALDAGRLAAARRTGARAQALAHQVFDPAAGAEAVICNGVPPTAAWLAELRLAVASGDEGADALVRRAEADVQSLAAAVPEAYRDGFLQRQPVNLALQALAAQRRSA